MITNDNIYVKYLIRRSRICSIHDIRHAYVINVKPSLLIYQFCHGNRDIFGFAACCRRLKDLGDVCIYTRRSRNLVLLQLKKEHDSVWMKVKRDVVMPENLDKFIDELKLRGISVSSIDKILA